MSTNRATRNAFIACLALFGLACGQKPGQATTQNPEENKNPTPATAPDENANPTPAPITGVLEQIPSSAFIVVNFSQPEKSAGTIKSLLEKVGGVLDNEEVKGELEKLRTEIGIDPFDPEVLKKLGIDSSRGIAFAFDTDFVYKTAHMLDWAATVELERKPAVYAVLALSDQNAFYTWVKETLPKGNSSSTFRFEDDLVGDLKAVYIYETPKASGALIPEEETKEASLAPAKEEMVLTNQVQVAEAPPAGGAPALRRLPPPSDMPPPKPPVIQPLPPEPPPTAPQSVLTEELIGVMVNKGDFVYFFFLNDLAKPSIPEIPDLIATFKNDLKDFFARAGNPITQEASFQAAVKKVDPQKGFFFYLDSAKTEAIVKKTDQPELIFLTPKDQYQKESQENEKKWRAEMAARGSEGEAIGKAIVAAVPAFAFSANLDEKKAELDGVAQVGSSYQTKLQKVLTPTTTVPAYGTVFPESTTFFYRYSVNFAALKEMIFELLPADIRTEAEKGWQQVNAMTLAMAGLDLDKDILGAFTGHVAIGMPSMESFLMPFFFLFEPTGGPPPSPQLPVMLIAAQLTTPDAGDKLLTAVEKLLTTQVRLPVQTEEVDGNKVYSVNIEGVSFAWGRAENLLFLGNTTQTVKDAFGRVKTPGASFADKLGGTLAKDLVTHASASGLTFHLGNLLNFFSLQPGIDQEGKEVMGKLGKLFGTLTVNSYYEEGAMQFSGELTLQ